MKLRIIYDAKEKGTFLFDLFLIFFEEKIPNFLNGKFLKNNPSFVNKHNFDSQYSIEQKKFQSKMLIRAKKLI